MAIGVSFKLFNAASSWSDAERDKELADEPSKCENELRLLLNPLPGVVSPLDEEVKDLIDSESSGEAVCWL